MHRRFFYLLERSLIDCSLSSFPMQPMIANFGWDGVFKVLAGVSVVATLLTSMLTPLASLPSSTV
jgi:sugar phosphate permease